MPIGEEYPIGEDSSSYYPDEALVSFTVYNGKLVIGDTLLIIDDDEENFNGVTPSMIYNKINEHVHNKYGKASTFAITTIA